MSGLHPSARLGFSAGVDAYVAGRPGYPPQVDTWLRDSLKLKACMTALDVGAGTGHFTRALLEVGPRVIAVEPVASMRERLAADWPEVDVRDGLAEALPVADSSADAIVCAQSFHWFSTAGTLEEFRRVLKIGGRLGLVWNVRDFTIPWVAALSHLVARYRQDAPSASSLSWIDLFPAPGFSGLEIQSFANFHEGRPERVVIDRLLSTSFIAAQPAETRAHIAEEARAILRRFGVVGDRVAFPYRTWAFSSERIS